MKNTTTSPDETLAFARKFARSLKPGDILALVGELGAGKTCFVSGLAEGLGVDTRAYVRSPSFTLMNEYKGGRLTLFHFDFYRLKNAAELDLLGLYEYFDGGGVTVIEWADKFPETLPKRTRVLEFRVVDETTREISCATLQL